MWIYQVPIDIKLWWDYIAKLIFCAFKRLTIYLPIGFNKHTIRCSECINVLNICIRWKSWLNWLLMLILRLRMSHLSAKLVKLWLLLYCSKLSWLALRCLLIKFIRLSSLILGLLLLSILLGGAYFSRLILAKLLLNLLLRSKIIALCPLLTLYGFSRYLLVEMIGLLLVKQICLVRLSLIELR